MICWSCLRKISEFGCSCSRDRAMSKAEFFKALVGNIECGMHAATAEATDELFIDYSTDRAAAVMSEIERRVEAGTLFGGGGREEGA